MTEFTGEHDSILHALRRTHRVRNINVVEAESLTRGQRFADRVAGVIGSWRFIVAQSVILVIWITLNIIGWRQRWDPYPFILLNLALSFQAAYSAPVIMMSQNRQASKDRLQAEHDYQINLKAELEVTEIRTRLDELAGSQWEALIDLQRQQLDLLQRIEQLSRDIRLLNQSLD